MPRRDRQALSGTGTRTSPPSPEAERHRERSLTSLLGTAVVDASRRVLDKARWPRAMPLHGPCFASITRRPHLLGYGNRTPQHGDGHE